jgi:hypothetical protein
MTTRDAAAAAEEPDGRSRHSGKHPHLEHMIGETWDVIALDEKLAPTLAERASDLLDHTANILRVAASIATLDYSDIPTSGSATGYLSAPTTITTAAHAVRNRDGRRMSAKAFAKLAVKFCVRDAQGKVVGILIARPVVGTLRFERAVDVARFEVTFPADATPPPPLELGKIDLDEPVALVMNGPAPQQFVSASFGAVLRHVSARRAIHSPCDTRPGFSGSPVFNPAWRVVATHTRHCAEILPPLNEGIVSTRGPRAKKKEGPT